MGNKWLADDRFLLHVDYWTVCGLPHSPGGNPPKHTDHRAPLMGLITPKRLNARLESIASCVEQQFAHPLCNCHRSREARRFDAEEIDKPFDAMFAGGLDLEVARWPVRRL